MADEPKVPPQPVVPGETPAKGPAAEGGGAAPPAAPATPAGAPPAKADAPEGGAPAKPAAPPKPAAAAAAPPKPPALPKPPAKPDPWTSPLLDEIKKRFPVAVMEAVTFRNQPTIVLQKDFLVAVCEFLKSDEGGTYAYLADETAVDYPRREKRFDIIYVLYSFKANNRIRLKIAAGDGEKVPSVVNVWPVANWLEREVFDMFGVEYEGHPDLRRILLPAEWIGHPLRKDYDILHQDEAWVKANLHIESGQ